MRTLHRIVATLLLIMFVPAALAAGPMRYCVGGDGHHGIELVHLLDDDTTQQLHGFSLDVLHALTAKALTTAAIAEDGQGCIDIPLLPAAVAAQASAPSAKHLLESRADWDSAPARIPTVACVEAAQTAPFFEGSFDIANARLRSLRTVILLI